MGNILCPLVPTEHCSNTPVHVGRKSKLGSNPVLATKVHLLKWSVYFTPVKYSACVYICYFLQFYYINMRYAHTYYKYFYTFAVYCVSLQHFLSDYTTIMLITVPQAQEMIPVVTISIIILYIRTNNVHWVYILYESIYYTGYSSQIVPFSAFFSNEPSSQVFGSNPACHLLLQIT